MQVLESRDNPVIKRLCRLMQKKSARREQGLFVAEGVRLCREAALSGVVIEQAFFTREAAEKYPEDINFLISQSKGAAEISPAAARKISDTPSPQGVFCLCALLDNEKTLATINSDGKYLALCSLQDPGNIGTIVRTAEAFGVDGLILTGDCPDIYSPKVLRSTMGSAFRLPIAVTGDLFSVIARMREAGVAVYGAALTDRSVPITGLDFSRGAMTLIGNEGSGLPPDLLAACDQTVRIPMKGRAESLNAAVAAAVALWEMTR
ncbi:TrmH family RNA methyltransferase [Zongyangia hominis]|uniref:RNA methyltransferase n=1 Tax=Zongyangia hominis TaxID=2763677 RepID=A0A926I9K6_9FIRM|nr:RNA methyltransferase [Zongyangia hominis]MBC8569251.1 RNA methyltransferase [Zongyangia hominis]